jgi:hypothetical protein
MELNPVIAHVRAYVPVFAGRVAGAARFQILPEAAALAVPCAFVIPLDDNPQDSFSQNTTRQRIADAFAVIVALDNTLDERGQAAAVSVHSARGQLWAALLGWQPDPDRYNGVEYDGGTLLAMDRARVWYQFEFSAATEIGPDDGWQATQLAGLPPFEGANISVDVIDPAADPNLSYPGPDGRIEHEVRIPKTGSLPT